MNEVNESESEDEDDEKVGRKKKRDPLKVKGELLISDLPPIEDLKITVPENECLEIGIITSIVDQLVLVEAYLNSAPLDIDSVLFLESGKKTLGAVFDVLGQVAQPLYCVRFNSNEDIIAKGIQLSQKVFCAPRTEYTQFVILPTLMKQKGSDASWRDDVEPPQEHCDHSDDENERQLKRNRKINRNRGNGEDAGQNNLYQNAQNNQSNQHNQGNYNRRGRGGFARPQWNRHQDYSWHNNNMFQPPSAPAMGHQHNGFQGNPRPSFPFAGPPPYWNHTNNQQNNGNQ